MVKVDEADRFAPVFEKTTYYAELEEGKLYENIIKVTAKDSDKSADNQNICGYDILTKDVPFIMEKDGK